MSSENFLRNDHLVTAILVKKQIERVRDDGVKHAFHFG